MKNIEKKHLIAVDFFLLLATRKTDCGWNMFNGKEIQLKTNERNT